MIYCTLIEHDEHSAIYAFGASDSDITGTLVFEFKSDEFRIINAPNKEMAPKRHIERLYYREKENFMNGCFKEIISYETA